MSSRRVPVNAAWLLLGRVFGAGLAVAILSLASHRLSVGDFGLVVSTMAAGFLANTLVTFGTDTVVTRAVAAERDDAVATSRLALKLQLGAASTLAVIAAIALALGAPAVVLIQAVALLPMAVVTVAGAALRGRQRMDHLLITTVVGGTVALGCCLAFFSFSTGAWVPIASFGVGSTISAVGSGWFATRGLRGPRAAGPCKMSAGGLAALVRETAPFAAMVLLAAVGTQAGLLLVEFIGDESTGGYGVALRLSEAARLVPAAAMGAFFPAMLSGLHHTDRYRRWLRWLTIYAGFATIALIALAAPINRIVFDSQPAGAPLIRILALGLVFTVARLALSFEFIASGRERLVLISALVGAAVTIIGGAATAQPFGAQGVAWSQLVGLIAATAVLAARRSSMS